jgi:large subunit ribosomal protein L10
MSKLVKSMVMRDYAARLAGANDAMVVSIRGMSAIDTTKMRSGLAKSKIKLTVIRNNLAKNSFKGTGLETLVPLLSGPSAVVYGGQSVVEVAREIVKVLGDFPKLELKGAVLDGNLFSGKAGIEELSKYPTREEAIGKAVTLIISPGRNLLAQIKGPGGTVGGLIKAIEAKLEKGEAITKVA